MKKIYEYLKENKNIRMLFISIVLMVIVLQFIKIGMKITLKENTINIIKDSIVLKIDNTTKGTLIRTNSKITLILTDLIVIMMIARFVIYQKDRMTKSVYVIMAVLLSSGISNLLDRIFNGGIINYIQIIKFKNPLCFNLDTLLIFIAFIIFAFVTAMITNKTVKEVKIINNKIQNKLLEKDIK